MNIALLGFGVVGRGVYDLVKNIDGLAVTKVVCLEDVSLPDATVTKDFTDVLGDDIDIVVEAMGGLHPAFEFVSKAMEAGKHVVTSNKALVATFYDTLLPLAQSKGICFRCTAAVGGGIGWLSELERTRRTQQLKSVGGIMNGTCNYILDSMTRLSLGYDEALKQAQGLGYAEANPSTDVEGIDTWHKTILSSNIGFAISLDPATVPVAGISRISKADVDAFTAMGLVCKLIGTGRQAEGKISAFVQPTLVSASSLEAAVPLNYNLISFDGEASGPMRFYGQGAGRYPTAHNVVQDCADVLAGNGFYSPYGPKTQADNSLCMRYYVRGNADSWLEENTAEALPGAVLTKPVSVAAIHGWLKDHPEAFIAALAE